ncbi:MAG: ABC transporter ATP-binding protein, partial [Bacteroidales bacterium]|nr:ABC transporter ATP-binding protein [Bacteroidales bacterium]
MSASDKLLEVSDLTVSFRDEKKGWRKVVDGVSYQLERGQTLGIVGESGSGKSVSTLALLGLLPSDTKVSGSAIFGPEGTDLLTLGEQEFRAIRGRRISMVFQEPMTSLNPVQKCGAQVVEMLMQHVNTST